MYQQRYLARIRAVRTWPASRLLCTVGVGRPYAYGLALEGTNGIIHVLRSLLAEADLIMAVDGYPTLKDLRVDGAIRRAVR